MHIPILRRLAVIALAAISLLAPALANAESGTITAEGVKLRERADKDSNALRELSLGSEAEVLAQSGGWYRVMLPDETVGYVRQDYIFIQSGGSRGAYVLDDGAALRGGPDENTYVVQPLVAGQGVRVKRIVGEWYFVSASDQAGYVHRKHLTMTTASMASASMLKQGMEGEEVEKLQKELNRRGFLGNDALTGTYSSATRKAVVEYQQAAGLGSADGVAGAETLNSIYDSTNKLKKETATYTQLKGTVILLNWFKGGSDWLHKGAKFTITDVKTGLSFRARRFGGWYHADSEPITANDTAIMKRIAGGKWSWDRRAIWVTYGGKTVAASMHCMPHMADPTKSNNFDGHFCVHLLGSKVHETSKECPRHQACVQAAYRAGR
ncbi:MAG: SH3 domain-containing protein [Candidatus Pelethousia sp.]|nr:SH3 domain-containing protein [Candidatus Pelethousia sp.]